MSADDFKDNTVKVTVDENENFVEKIDGSSLNYIFSTEANIDQTSREFVRDIVMSMFDEGCVAIVPVETDIDPETGSYSPHVKLNVKMCEVEWMSGEIPEVCKNQENWTDGPFESIIIDEIKKATGSPNVYITFDKSGILNVIIILKKKKSSIRKMNTGQVSSVIALKM